MKQFTQLLLFILLSSALQLSASEINRNDTIGKFNEITDIELRLKKLLDNPQQSTTTKNVSQDTPIFPQEKRVVVEDTVIAPQNRKQTPITTVTLSQDTTVTPLEKTTVRQDTIVAPKLKPGFAPPVIRTSLDYQYTRKSNGTIELPEPPPADIDAALRALFVRLHLDPADGCGAGSDLAGDACRARHFRLCNRWFR